MEFYKSCVDILVLGILGAMQIRFFPIVRDSPLRTMEFADGNRQYAFLLKYVAPQASLFGDISGSESLFNNTRVYGTILCFLVMVCVFIGIRFVSKFAVLSLAAVLISILCIYIGIFVASPARSPL
ncbi:unnamed protein product [Dibothriocephalus latus]|uniref:Uncharacterized protein n=1 Tax=Dibothriocephalus latus TaxID=60516 RepID=A0A3P7LNB0_DIBLA|nr:unnamed protein product [Dibothriocephalus latus]